MLLTVKLKKKSLRSIGSVELLQNVGSDVFGAMAKISYAVTFLNPSTTR